MPVSQMAERLSDVNASLRGTQRHVCEQLDEMVIGSSNSIRMLRPEDDDPSSTGQPRPWAKSWTRRSTRSCSLSSVTDTVISPSSLLPLFCSLVPWSGNRLASVTHH